MTKIVTEGTAEYTNTKLPDCSGYKAFVIPGAFYGACVSLMAEAGFQRADSVQDADVVVFIGGEDIDPNLYGETVHPTTSYNTLRDTVEVSYYRQCFDLKKVMFGICRGAQFLHAMNGGKLWQDVNGHAGDDHYVVDLERDVRVEATSIHHQMLKTNKKMTLIAVTEDRVATRFSDGTMSMRVGVSEEEPLEVEAGCYTETGCFFVQGHPEIGSPEYRSWCMEKLLEFIIEWELHNKGTKELSEEQLITVAV